MNMTTEFKNKILWRIYIVWFLRRIVPLMAAQVLLLAAGLKIFAGKVWVARVLENAAGVGDNSYWGFIQYLFYAFFNTRPLTQIVILLVLGFGALLIRDASRAVFTLFKTTARNSKF